MVVPKQIIVRDIERRTLCVDISSGADNAVSVPRDATMVRTRFPERQQMYFLALNRRIYGRAEQGSAAPPFTDKAR